MKKFVSVLLFVVLAGVFIPGIGIHHALAAPKSGGTLTFNMFPDPSTLGAPLNFRGPDHEYIDNTLQTLLIPSNDKMGVFEPRLAESWKFSSDKSSCTVKLRKGIKFHDGTNFNAQAVKWNHEQWMKSVRPRLNKVKSIDIIDDHTVRYNLKEWNAVFISDLAKDTYIISPTAFEKNGEEWANTHPVGTGPFKFKSYKRKTKVSFEKFDDYWIEGLPYLDGINIIMIPDPMTSSASFRRKELDAVRVDYILGAELKKEGKYELIYIPTGHAVLSFNSKDPNSIWSNKKVREALEYALDKEKISKVITRDFGFPIYEIVHSVNAIPPGPGTTFRKYDLEKAKQLMKEAGVPKGLKIDLTYGTVGPAGSSRDYIVILLESLKAIGITAVPNALSPAAFSQKEFEPPNPNEILATGQRGSANELLISVNETLGPGSIFFTGIKKPDGFMNLLDKALATEDLNQTYQYLYEMEGLAYGDAMFVPVNAQAFITAQHHYVKDAVWFWGAMPYPNLERTWLDK